MLDEFLERECPHSQDRIIATKILMCRYSDMLSKGYSRLLESTELTGKNYVLHPDIWGFFAVDKAIDEMIGDDFVTALKRVIAESGTH